MNVTQNTKKKDYCLTDLALATVDKKTCMEKIGE